MYSAARNSDGLRPRRPPFLSSVGPRTSVTPPLVYGYFNKQDWKYKVTLRLGGEAVGDSREDIDLSDGDYAEEDAPARRSTRVRHQRVIRKSTRQSKRRRVRTPSPDDFSSEDDGRDEYAISASESSDDCEDTYEAKHRTPKRMTKRQKAMRSEEPSQMLLLESPILSTVILSEEEQIVKAEAALRRKRQQQKQNEELKSQTVRKLLSRTKTKRSKIKEQERVAAESNKKKDLKQGICYRSSPTGTFLSVMPDVQMPTFCIAPAVSPAIKPCAIESCERPSRYACATSGLRVCGLDCYKVANSSAG